MARKRIDPRDKCLARGQWCNATDLHFYEFPTEDPDHLEIWGYTDKLSYAPGETVRFHTSTTASEYSIRVLTDDLEPQTLFSVEALPGMMHPTPDNAYAAGCGWPSAWEWTIPAETDSCPCVVSFRARNSDGEQREQQHFFVIRSAAPGKDKKLLLICATSTWIAYNEWGGSNSYWGVPEAVPDPAGQPGSAVASAQLSIHRPWSRGFVWVPEGAPRCSIDYRPLPNAVPRYPMIEYAFAYGLSKYYAAAGWAMYERHFVHWAQSQDYALDLATQHDLHYRPEILDNYDCVVLVGHDEYWSWEMRDAVEAFLERGGHVARFGANFVWQIRLENEGNTQVCHKLPESDPLHGTDRQQLLTTAWESPLVARPGAETLGLNGLGSGVYAHWAAFNPRSTGGYTVYRPEHWVFANTDLYYGDVLGSEAGIFGYEVDGVAFDFKHGLPYPTGEDGAPSSLEILAMAPASMVEENHKHKGTFLFDGSGSWDEVSQLLFGKNPTDEEKASIRHGAGMMAMCTRGRGTVFNAGSCEWVNGLKLKNFATEQVTSNVLNRFLEK